MACSDFNIDTWCPLFNLMMTANVRLCPLGPGLPCDACQFLTMLFYLLFSCYYIAWWRRKDVFFLLTINIFIALQSSRGWNNYKWWKTLLKTNKKEKREPFSSVDWCIDIYIWYMTFLYPGALQVCYGSHWINKMIFLPNVLLASLIQYLKRNPEIMYNTHFCSLLDTCLFLPPGRTVYKSNSFPKSLLEATGILCYNQLHTDKCFIHITQLKKNPPDTS